MFEKNCVLGFRSSHKTIGFPSFSPEIILCARMQNVLYTREQLRGNTCGLSVSLCVTTTWRGWLYQGATVPLHCNDLNSWQWIIWFHALYGWKGFDSKYVLAKQKLSSSVPYQFKGKGLKLKFKLGSALLSALGHIHKWWSYAKKAELNLTHSVIRLFNWKCTQFFPLK